MIYSVDLDGIGELMLAVRRRGPEHFYMDTRTGQVEFLSERLLTAVLRKDKAVLDSLPQDERENDFMAELVLANEDQRFLNLAEIEEVSHRSLNPLHGSVVDPEGAEGICLNGGPKALSMAFR